MKLTPQVMATVNQDDVLEELVRRRTRADFRAFFHAFPPAESYKYGIHTLRLLHELNETTYRVEAGNNRYLCVCIPPRHGKSDIVSRRWPAWNLIRDPSWEHIIASYNYTLASNMGYDVRELLKDVGMFYGRQVKQDRSQVGSWGIVGNKGMVHSAGLGGTIAGRGATHLIIDDYCKNREEAESALMRKKVWESFESDLMTRLAPVHSVAIVANRWHQDDLVGRIRRKNNPKDEWFDPDFPVFEIIEFPAVREDGGLLFPERFSPQYYKAMKAFMGTYAWNAQGLQHPGPRTGNMLMADQVIILDPEVFDKETQGSSWTRGWDLASTSKELMKEDPDFTVGTKTTYRQSGLYIADERRGQWSATKRDKIMTEVAIADGANCRVYVEAVAGYVDTFDRVRNLLRGKAVVKKFTPSNRTDKVARAEYLSPVFEAGVVKIRKAPWNEGWLEEIAAFPSAPHDDRVDSLVAATYDTVGTGRRMGLSR